ncbi:hypothetical protein CC78DRAFT_563934 [Lojkania enalia]|uniref:Uncharacterized protein n=1 Tax=Lojkania enalia TaxID=147567 RepID=A0A9P4NC80_9PLEO|nr:hypothetical protein CC78DRAFT_563934 [Didymosphaeria enalia]
MASDSESSLPAKTEPVHFNSSPPPLLETNQLNNMDNNQASQPIPSPINQEDPSNAPAGFRAKPAETEPPPSAQHVRQNGNGQGGGSEADGTEDGSNPEDKITDFDWHDLEWRYHNAMRNCQQNEQQLLEEWRDLMSFFDVWASSGHEHETGRTYKRLKTRMAHVQHSEEELERTRNHYINVVTAFQSVFKIMNATQNSLLGLTPAIQQLVTLTISQRSVIA